jgi:hypothetical protein
VVWARVDGSRHENKHGARGATADDHQDDKRKPWYTCSCCLCVRRYLQDVLVVPGPDVEAELGSRVVIQVTWCCIQKMHQLTADDLIA